MGNGQSTWRETANVYWYHMLSYTRRIRSSIQIFESWNLDVNGIRLVRNRRCLPFFFRLPLTLGHVRKRRSLLEFQLLALSLESGRGCWRAIKASHRNGIDWQTVEPRAHVWPVTRNDLLAVVGGVASPCTWRLSWCALWVPPDTFGSFPPRNGSKWATLKFA